jgi:hypothetical protein
MDTETPEICLYLSKTEAIFSAAMSQIPEYLLDFVKRSVFVIYVVFVQSLMKGLVLFSCIIPLKPSGN